MWYVYVVECDGGLDLMFSGVAGKKGDSGFGRCLFKSVVVEPSF